MLGLIDSTPKTSKLHIEVTRGQVLLLANYRLEL
jgi:hypothetical protein